MRKILLLLLSVVFTLSAFAQTRTITGKLLDAQTKEPLIGAGVSEKGTANGVQVSLDGSFKLKVKTDGPVTVVFTYVGYVPKEMIATQNNLGTVTLDPSSNAIKEVVVQGDIAVDRKTPIAVTTVNQQMIEEKLGSQDLPELLRISPGVMVTNTTGFGDSRVSIRGFSSTSKNGNVALTINGIPVNDMENGNTYWSDFTGLSDVTTSMQVQRGLGASKIIVPSFGGTINITTRSTDAVKGGYIYQAVGSNNYMKTGVLVSTGLNKNGWAATFQGSRTSGDGNADQLNFLNYNYFFNLSKVINPHQSLSFSVMGAAQSHNTRFYAPLSVYKFAPQGVNYNSDAGVLYGKDYDPYQNFYSKPVASLNHSWTINEKSSLYTVLYATYGTGGGVSLSSSSIPHVNGNTNGLYDYSPYDLTSIAKANAASPDGSATNYIKTAYNNHHWFGLRSTYSTSFLNNINFSGGIDGRYYEGIHYTAVNDLLGAQYVLDNTNKNAPNTHAMVGDKISYYNVDDVAMGGLYAQGEYTKKDLSVFITLSGSETANKRNDYFTYLNTDPLQHSAWKSYFTYQAKGGANYNINEHMNVFANVGYITKPPYFDNIFQNFTNTVNNATVPEKLFSYEAGYKYQISGFAATLNLYRSLYMDRSYVQTFRDGSDTYSGNLTGVTELHQGAELELRAKPIKEVTIGGMFSLGDWYYTKDAGPVSVYNSAQKLVGTVKNVYLKGIKVGDAAQTTAALYADVDVLPELRVGANYYYYGNYTASFLFQNATTSGLTPWKIPNYNLVNLNASFKFKFAGLDATLYGNVYNLLNTKYVSDAYDNTLANNPASTSLNVYMGYGRTFATSIKVRF